MRFCKIVNERNTFTRKASDQICEICLISCTCFFGLHMVWSKTCFQWAFILRCLQQAVLQTHFAFHPVCPSCKRTQGYMSHFILKLPFPQNAAFIGLVPQVWYVRKLVAEWFGATCKSLGGIFETLIVDTFILDRQDLLLR